MGASQNKQPSGAWILVAIVLLGGLAGGSISAGVATVVVLVAQLLVHEVGHLLAAMAFGFEVLGLRLGSGATLVTSEIAGTEVAVRVLPIEASVRIGTGRSAGLRGRSFAVALAGPGTALVALALALAVAPPAFRPGIVIGLAINLFNLLPIGGSDSAAATTDGYVALQSLVGPRQWIQDKFLFDPSAAAVPRPQTREAKLPAHARALLREAGAAHDRNQARRMKTATDKLAAQFPDLVQARIAAAHTHAHYEGRKAAAEIEALMAQPPDGEWAGWATASFACAAGHIALDEFAASEADARLLWAQRTMLDPVVGARSHHILAWALVVSGDLDGARTEIDLDHDVASESLPLAAHRQGMRGIVRARLGDTAESIACLARARNYDPGSDAAKHLAQVVLEQGLNAAGRDHEREDFDAMKARAQLILDAFPDSLVARFAVVHASTHLAPRDAAPQLAELCNLEPEVQYANWYRGNMGCAATDVAWDAVLRQAPAEALAWVERAQGAQTQADWLHGLRAAALAQCGDIPAAQLELARAEALTPAENSYEAARLAHRAVAYASLDEMPTARDLLDRARTLDPECTELRAAEAFVSASDRFASGDR